jgi:PTH1 family peptidyl-tRNA hydrolase
MPASFLRPRVRRRTIGSTRTAGLYFNARKRGHGSGSMKGTNKELISLVVGLGNPGGRYASTRHNAGFMALEELAGRRGASFKKYRGIETGSFACGSREVKLARPLDFMNRSGEAVKQLRRRFRLDPREILVIYDDIDLAAGVVRVRRGGSSGGHLGLQSIIDHLGNDLFARVRIGVGRPPSSEEAADYVLEALSGEALESLRQSARRGADAVEVVLDEGIDVAMNRFNQAAKA